MFRTPSLSSFPVLYPARRVSRALFLRPSCAEQPIPIYSSRHVNALHRGSQGTYHRGLAVRRFPSSADHAQGHAPRLFSSEWRGRVVSPASPVAPRCIRSCAQTGARSRPASRQLRGSRRRLLYLLSSLRSSIVGCELVKAIGRSSTDSVDRLRSALPVFNEDTRTTTCKPESCSAQRASSCLVTIAFRLPAEHRRTGR